MIARRLPPVPAHPDPITDVMTVQFSQPLELFFVDPEERHCVSPVRALAVRYRDDTEEGLYLVMRAEGLALVSWIRAEHLANDEGAALRIMALRRREDDRRARMIAEQRRQCDAAARELLR